ncbi:MAG: dihydroneopterin aldolase [Chloroflexota bacterium]|nr:dihydroneopterin aldolase [Chloroflexota bacterium]
MDKIFVNNLQVYGILGIHLHEQRIPQLIQISLCATTDIKDAAINDDIQQTINYSTLIKQIIQFIDNSRYRTIEALIETLATELLSDKQITSIWLRIEKPNAVPNTESVGVEITRNNTN